MKYILLLMLVFICYLGNAQDDDSTKKWIMEWERGDTVKVYYFFWTANHGNNSAFGENHIPLKHRPTKKEIKRIVLNMVGRNWWGEKYLIIEDIIEFKNRRAYEGWNRGAPIQEITNAIRLFRPRKN